MARLIKCPRCQSQIDVTSVSGGATVRCPDCGSMVRVPTGNTGVHTKVQAQVPQPAAAVSKGDTRVRTGGRQTDLFRKMSGVRGPGERPGRGTSEGRSTGVRRKQSNTGLVIGGAVGGVALIGILIFAMMSKQANEQKAKEDKARKLADERAKAKREADEIMKENAAIEAAAEEEKKAKKEGRKPALQKVGGAYKAPDSFELNAEKWVPKGIIEEFPVEAKLYQEYEGMVTSGKTSDLGRDEAKWFTCMIKGTLSENERIARESLNCILNFCTKKGITTESGKPAVSMEFFNSSQWRAGEYQRWSEWYSKNKGKLEGASAPGASAGPQFGAEDPEKANWIDLLTKARAGGGFEDPSTQEGNAFGRIQAMGPGAYPKLVSFIDNEDPGLGRAAVTLLNRLTSNSSPLPTEATRAQIKSEWEARIKK